MSKRMAFPLLPVVWVCFLAGPAAFFAGTRQPGASLAVTRAGILSGPPETHRFVADATFSVGAVCRGVIAGDLRNDGVIRLVIGTDSTNYAYVYRKQGTSYVEEWNHLYDAADDAVTPAAVGDVDNDGLNEFLISVRNTHMTYMYRWDGATYQKVHEQYFAGNYQPAAIFDIDRDGANELIMDGSGAGLFVSVYNYDSGSGTFLLAWSAPKGDALQIAVGDPDNDGQREAVVALPWDYPPGTMMIIGYDGSAYSVEATITSFASGLGGAAVADFDGDGKEEIISGLFNVAATQFPVYLVKHDGAQYNVTTLYDAGHGTFLVQAGDIDRDGLPEAVITVNSKAAEVIDCQNGAYTSVSVSSIGGSHVFLAETDGDNRAEIILCPYSIYVVSDTAGRSFLGADIVGTWSEEIIGDLATEGLWYWNNTSWIQLTPVEPEGLAAANFDGDTALEIAADFGSLGLWIWNGGVWSAITGLNPEGLIAASLDGTSTAALVADFGKAGLWKWEGGSWSQLTGGNVQDMLFADPDGDWVREFIGDFGPLGLWRWDGGTWTCLSTVDADLLASALVSNADDTEEIIAGFGAYGLWMWQDGVWSQLSGARAEHIVAGSVNGVPGDEVFADFGALGLWLRVSAGWTQLSGGNADFMVLGKVNGSHRLAADFGAQGLWLWSNPNWYQISALNPDTLAVVESDTDGYDEFVVDFGTTGIWLWNDGSWSRIK